MDKNTWIGFLLIAAIIVGFSMLNRPSKEELAERQRINDSIAMVHQMEEEAERISAQITADLAKEQEDSVVDETLLQRQITAVYGPFAPAATGDDWQEVILENNKLRLHIGAKGGTIREAEMKEYKQQDEDVLSYAWFPQVATEFFKYRQAQQTGVDVTKADAKTKSYPV